MNSTPGLDSFESALLAELRREVAEHPVTAPAPARRSRRRLRVAAVAAAGAAASVVAVFGLGGAGGSPAYAVDQNSAGDVIVTVHALDDAAGLEKALRARGIDADVSYDGHGVGSSLELGTDGKPLPGGLQPPVASPPGLPLPGDGAQQHSEGLGEAGGSEESGPAQSGPDPAGDDPCGLGSTPATLKQQGDDWVLTIPADSPLQDRHVDIGTDASGALSVAYAGDEPNSMCGMVSVTRGTPPA